MWMPLRCQNASLNHSGINSPCGLCPHGTNPSSFHHWQSPAFHTGPIATSWSADSHRTTQDTVGSYAGPENQTNWGSVNDLECTFTPSPDDAIPFKLTCFYWIILSCTVLNHFENYSEEVFLKCEGVWMYVSCFLAWHNQCWMFHERWTMASAVVIYMAFMVESFGPASRSWGWCEQIDVVFDRICKNILIDKSLGITSQ